MTIKRKLPKKRYPVIKGEPAKAGKLDIEVDIDDYVKKSTKASGVSLKVTDKAVLMQIAGML